MALESASARPRYSGSRRQHRAVCAGCGKPATVPFRPSQDRPVYCSPCFKLRRNNSPTPTGTAAGESFTANQSSPSPHSLGDGPSISAAPVFAGIGLESLHYGSAFPYGHIRAYANPGEDYPSSSGRPRRDWTGTHGVWQDPGVRRPLGGTVRPVGPALSRRWCWYPLASLPSRWPR